MVAEPAGLDSQRQRGEQGHPPRAPEELRVVRHPDGRNSRRQPRVRRQRRPVQRRRCDGSLSRKNLHSRKWVLRRVPSSSVVEANGAVTGGGTWRLFTHFADLSPNSYFGPWEDVLISIGWLDGTQDYVRGVVSHEFFRALVRLLDDPWQPAVFAGRAPCPLCQFSGGPAALSFEGSRPSLVAHYIDAHGYVPPQEFQRAVLACPPMGSLEYRKALLERGIR
jgi:hypothetical protein